MSSNYFLFTDFCENFFEKLSVISLTIHVFNVSVKLAMGDWGTVWS